MKIADIIREDITSVDKSTDLRTMLAAVREEMEAVDDASMGSQEGDARYAGLSVHTNPDSVHAVIIKQALGA
jgi:predicted aldo/keto reductase-like oxidoreductase